MNYKNQAFAKLFFLYILAFYIFVPVDLCLLRDFVLNDTFCVLAFSEMLFSLHINQSYKVRFINVFSDCRRISVTDFELDYFLAWGIYCNFRLMVSKTISEGINILYL